MKKINFLNEKGVYSELQRIFPTQPVPLLSKNLRGLDDSERVYDFFQGKEWIEVANYLNLKNDSYALELGVVFLPEDIFRYYTPAYIYASLFNKRDYWVFESDFIQQYLCPEFHNHDDFLNFILKFSDHQLCIVAQFMLYESEILGFSYASKACIEFWNDFL
ncbi:hypothetical protein L6Y89_02055 [Enterobacter mori]|uniref:hypothetical protein n=1 Tax=Enterobacter mori TaxID=539813 RepID=UPI001EDB6155|nr:hypothetical protein [Enterobacter mori]UKJ21807.1 hypothetical protein L6Y89_02055 [Enterobacter mori]